MRLCFCSQDGPGKYNDDVWEALDRVLDEARRAGLKVMLSFLDNWKYIGALQLSVTPCMVGKGGSNLDECSQSCCWLCPTSACQLVAALWGRYNLSFINTNGFRIVLKQDRELFKMSIDRTVMMFRGIVICSVWIARWSG